MKRITLSIILAFSTLIIARHGAQAQSTVTDIDGNIYTTVIIGDQEWMAKDLKVTKYRNGDAILTDQDHNQWQQSTEGIWAYYDNDPSNNDLYGKLYNWYATVDPRGLCPAGWRTPTDNDWQILEFFIDPSYWGNRNNVGKKLKSRRQVNSPHGGEYNTSEHPRWNDHPVNYGTDEFSFNSLPGGGYTNGNAFRHKGQEAYYWSSTEAIETHAWTRILLFSNLGSSRGQLKKSLGASVRCVKGVEQVVQVPQLNTIPASNITLNSANSGGEVLADGGAPVTVRGIVWSTAENPKVDDNMGITTDGSGLGIFTSNITGLNPGTIYWVRAYATNSAGTGYGIQVKVTTNSQVGLPTVITSQATNITSVSAVSGGNVTSEGGLLVSARGVVWSTAQDPTLQNNEGFTTDGSGSGIFYSTLTNLTPETVYYVKAYAINSEGTSYGNELSFETAEEVVVTTNTIVVNDASAASGSEVTIEIEMENQSDIVAFQMDFVLPEEFNYVDGSYTLSDRSQGHTPGQSILTDGKLRVLAYSSTNNVFLGNTGILFTFKLNTPAQAGTWNIEPTNIILTDTNFENVFDGVESGTLTLIETTAYGQPCPGIPTVTDIDGNVYNTVQIGGQCWMSENLKLLPEVMNTTMASDEIPHYYVYDYNGTNVDEAKSTDNFINYGVLYNWPAAMNGELSSNENPSNVQGLCPVGWHLPSFEEWKDLIYYVTQQGYPNDNVFEGAANSLKSCRQVNSPQGGMCNTSEQPRWNSDPTHYGKDTFNFGALPGGVFSYNESAFGTIGSMLSWWSSSETPQEWLAWNVNISCVRGNVLYYNIDKRNGYSIRCIKD